MIRALHLAAGNLYGGAERILVEIARTSAATGERPEFAICVEGRLSTALRAAGAAVVNLGEVRFSRPPSVWRARRRLRTHVLDAPIDVVVAHGAWAYALAAPASRGTRCVLWAHDAATGAHWTERTALAHAPALVICNSEYTQRAIAEWLPTVPMAVVYAPVTATVCEPGARAATRRELGETDDRFVILTASRFERWKGHVELLRAVSGLAADWCLWVAGAPQRPHEQVYVHELLALCDALGVRSRVRFLGHRDDVHRLMRGADVLCQPNTGPEPFGIVFVEALQAGLPVVTTKAGGAVEIVTPDCGLLVEPGDARGLAAALQSLAGDRELRHGLSRCGPSRAALLCDPLGQLRALETALAPAREGVLQ